MEQRKLVNGLRVQVHLVGRYNWQLSGDILPDDVHGKQGTIIPMKSIQGLPISIDKLLPLVHVHLDDSRTFMIHQDNLEWIDQ